MNKKIFVTAIVSFHQEIMFLVGFVCIGNNSKSNEQIFLNFNVGGACPKKEVISVWERYKILIIFRIQQES